MLKPYLYGGIVLLIVGLFSSTLYMAAKLETANTVIAQNTEDLASLRDKNEQLIESAARKSGAATAYNAMTEHMNQLTSSATGIIRGYRLRITENEKCLDNAPPPALIDSLRQNSLRGQGDIRKP